MTLDQFTEDAREFAQSVIEDGDDDEAGDGIARSFAALFYKHAGSATFDQLWAAILRVRDEVERDHEDDV